MKGDFIYMEAADHTDSENPFVCMRIKTDDLDLMCFIFEEERKRKYAERLRALADDLDELVLPTKEKPSD